jgi:hypothetical protein
MNSLNKVYYVPTSLFNHIIIFMKVNSKLFFLVYFILLWFKFTKILKIFFLNIIFLMTAFLIALTHKARREGEAFRLIIHIYIEHSCCLITGSVWMDIDKDDEWMNYWLTKYEWGSSMSILLNIPFQHWIDSM